MKTISNEQLTIQVSPYGAELCSILANGKEYLWQADPALLLFQRKMTKYDTALSVMKRHYRNILSRFVWK